MMDLIGFGTGMITGFCLSLAVYFLWLTKEYEKASDMNRKATELFHKATAMNLAAAAR